MRAFPSSRRYPHFNAGSLASWLPAAGIQYAGFTSLGGRRRPVPGSVNSGWRDAAFQGYADYMASSPQFAAALAELEALAGAVPTAVMCAEAVWWRCHRRLIADALTVRGWKVLHLGVGDSPAPHELTPFAVLIDGELRYPPSQRSLLQG